MNKNITKGNEFQKGGVWPNLMLIIERKLKKKKLVRKLFYKSEATISLSCGL